MVILSASGNPSGLSPVLYRTAEGSKIEGMTGLISILVSIGLESKDCKKAV